MGYFSISPLDLYKLIGTADAPLLYDVCKCEDYDTLTRMVPGARWRDHQRTAEWVAEIPQGRRVVAICVKGMKVSQAAVAELRLRGVDACILEGGNLAWEAAGLPTVLKARGIGNRVGKASRWVTRVRPKIDRIACPWLVSRFLDPAARFFFVNPDQVANAAIELDAIPYDIDGVELTHREETCSFDTIITEFGIKDAGLDRVARIVRGADTARLDLEPEAAGLLAISLGISHMAGPNDAIALEKGLPVYDALYAWARFAAGETHNWPSAKRPA